MISLKNKIIVTAFLLVLIILSVVLDDDDLDPVSRATPEVAKPYGHKGK